jgi:hypothetical protein
MIARTESIKNVYYKLQGRFYVQKHSTNTERRGRILNNPASCSGGPEFKSRPGDR